MNKLWLVEVGKYQREKLHFKKPQRGADWSQDWRQFSFFHIIVISGLSTKWRTLIPWLFLFSPGTVNSLSFSLLFFKPRTFLLLKCIEWFPCGKLFPSLLFHAIFLFLWPFTVCSKHHPAELTPTLCWKRYFWNWMQWQMYYFLEYYRFTVIYTEKNKTFKFSLGKICKAFGFPKQNVFFHTYIHIYFFLYKIRDQLRYTFSNECLCKETAVVIFLFCQ